MSFSFGATAAKPVTTTSNPFGSFGSTPAAAAPAPASTSLFGQQPQQPAQSTSLFGGGAQQQQQQPAAGGMFGQPAQPQQGQQQQSTGLFGSTTNQQSTTTGGGLFGSSTTQQPSTGGMFGSTTQQPATGGGGLFGSTTQPQTGGGMFGQTNNAGQQGGSLFGNNQQQQQQQQPQPQQGLFGMTGTTNNSNSIGSSMFGQPQQQQQQQAQQQQQQPLGQSTLWQSTIGGGTQEQDIGTRMMNVSNAWDPSSQEYKFKTFVYNVVDQGTTHQYGRQGLNDELWNMATRENPDPTTRVPVLVNGPQDLQKRRQTQIQMAAMQQQISKEITSALRHTRQKAWATDAKTRNLQARQTNLHDRLSRLVFQIDQALPPEGSADASTTAEIIQKLESSKAELEGGSLQARGGKESLRATVNQLRGRIAELRRFGVQQGNGEVGWLANPEAQTQVAEILSQHQLALEGLTGLLNRMEFDEGVIAKGLTELGEARH